MARLQQFIEHALRHGKTEADGRGKHRMQMQEINRRRGYNAQTKIWHDNCGPGCEHQQ